MSAIVCSVRKSNSWESDKTRCIAVVSFAKQLTNNASKFAVAALGDNERYTKSYDLALLYAKDAKNDEGVFSRSKAFELFVNELPVGTVEPINCYEFSISELSGGSYGSVVIKAEKREMFRLRPASYSDRERAKEQSRINLERRINAHDWEPVRKVSDDEQQVEGGMAD